MQSSFDSLNHVNGTFTCTGWAAPAQPGDHVSMVLKNAAGEVVEAQLKRIRRADVGFVLYGDNTYDDYGLEFVFTPEKIETYTAVFTSLEHPEDVLEKPVDCPGVIAAYRYRRSVRGRVRRLLKTRNLKDFLLEEKYKDLVGEEQKYAIWFEKNKLSGMGCRKQAKMQLKHNPLVSIIVPLYHTPLNFLQDMVESVKKQTYGNWELCLANGSPEDKELHQAVKALMHGESRIKYKRLSKNYGIAGNTNAALRMATGEYVALLDHDDFLMPNALFEFVKVINEHPQVDCIYSDEDKVDQDGKIHYYPHFKPDFNLDLLLSNNYICHFFMAKRSIINEIGGFRNDYDGAQDYDLILRCVEKSSEIIHVPQILYAWRNHRGSTSGNTDSKSYAFEAGARALNQYYERNHIPARVSGSIIPGYYRTEFIGTDRPLVTVIIANKDHKEDLQRCIEALQTKNQYSNLEILIVENNSETEEIFAYYHQLQESDPRIRVITWKRESEIHSGGSSFNYAAIHNFAVQHASGEYLLLLNNDTEVIDSDFLISMMGYAARADVGAVGARLLYPGDTVQHAGVIVGVEGVAYHQFLEYAAGDPGYMGRAVISQDVSAVTGACLLIRKDIYLQVGGMDERLAVSYNDVDLCLKLRDLGLRVVYDAYAQLYHFESRSRGYEDSPEKQARLAREFEYMKNKWEKYMGTDPYYNPNLSLKNGYYKLP